MTKYVSEKGQLSITGQFITELFNHGINEKGELDPDHVDEVANPQILRPDYLMRGRLEELNHSAFWHLANQSWSSDQILNGLKAVRAYLWTYWDEFIYLGPREMKSDFYTGAEANDVGPKSFRTWVNNSDPLFPLEYAPDDWFDSEEWADKKPSSWKEIYALVSLWLIDESVLYLNSNDVFKASVWLDRASISNLFFTFDTSGPANLIQKMGGQSRAKKYEPLKELLKEMVSAKEWPNRSEAARRITPAIIARGKELKVFLSETDPELRVYRWLTEMGLPKKNNSC